MSSPHDDAGGSSHRPSPDHVTRRRFARREARLAAVAALGGAAALALACSVRGTGGNPEPHGAALAPAHAENKAAPAHVRHPRPPRRNGHRIQTLLRQSHDLLGPLASGNDGGAFPDDANTPFGDFWWIGAYSTQTSAIPNSGVRMTAQVIDVPAQADGGCISYWTSDVLSNDIWGQIGYSACSIPGLPEYDLTSFFEVWDLSVGADGTELLDLESTDLTLGLHQFAMYLTTGTTWAYAVDGNVFGIYDMGSTTGNAANGVSTLCEEGDGVVAAFTPPSVEIPVAMEVLTGSAWGPATQAQVFNTAGLSGVVGHAQDTSLADDQLLIGGTSPTIDAGVLLWNGTDTTGGIDAAIPDGGASVPAYISVSCPTATGNLSGQVLMSAVATAARGIDNVSFYMDTFDSNPVCTVTSAPFDCLWDSTTVASGSHLLNVIVTDTAHHETFADFNVNVDQTAAATCGQVIDAAADRDAGTGEHDAGGADALAPDAGTTTMPDGSTDGDGGPHDGGAHDATAPATDGSTSDEDATTPTSDASTGTSDGSTSIPRLDASTPTTSFDAAPPGDDAEAEAGSGADPASSGGCGCAIPGGAHGGSPLAWAGLLGLFVVGARRRRSR